MTNACINEYKKEHPRLEAVLRLGAILAFVAAILMIVPWDAIIDYISSNVVAPDRPRPAVVFGVVTSLGLGLGLMSVFARNFRWPSSLKYTVQCALRGGRFCGVDEDLEFIIKKAKRVWSKVGAVLLILALLSPAMIPAASAEPTEQSWYSSVEVRGVVVPQQPSYAVIRWGNLSKTVRGLSQELSFAVTFEAEYLRSDLNITVYSRDGDVLFHAYFVPSPIGFALRELRTAEGTVFNSGAAIVIREPVFKVQMTVRTNLPVGDVKLKVNNVSVNYGIIENGVVAEWIGSPRPQHVLLLSSSGEVMWAVSMYTTLPGHGNLTIQAQLHILRGTDRIDVVGKYAKVEVIPYRQMSVTILNLSSSISQGEKVAGRGTGVILYVIQGNNITGSPGTEATGEASAETGGASEEATPAQVSTPGNNEETYSREKARMATYVFLAGVVVAFVGVMWRRMPWSAILTVAGVGMIAYSLFMA